MSALVTAVKWLVTAFGEAVLQRLVQRAVAWIVAVVESWLFGDLGTA